MNFSSNLFYYRKRKKLTRKDLAIAVDMTPAAIGLWEHGLREPSLNMLCNLAELLDVSLDELINGTPGAKAPGSAVSKLEALIRETNFQIESINEVQDTCTLHYVNDLEITQASESTRYTVPMQSIMDLYHKCLRKSFNDALCCLVIHTRAKEALIGMHNDNL